jgi:hypothetical protein
MATDLIGAPLTAPPATVADSGLTRALATIDERCSDPLMRAKLRGLMRGYDARYQKQDISVLEIEQTITSDLFNPGTGAKSRSFIMAGKKDVLLEEAGKLWLMDHKTCSEDIADPDASYWRQLVIEGQHQHYALLEHLNGRRIEGAIWDVTRKPSISPRQITKADQAAMSATKLYFGARVSTEDVQEVRETGRENYSLYEARIVFDATQTRPEWYFQRYRVARLDNELLEYAGELWGHTQELLIARRENRWPRNSGACMNYGHPCKFLGICSGHDTPDSANWQRKPWVHLELPSLSEDGNGSDVLTNSRVRCFQTCRRKHYYDYEIGIDRSEPEEAESLTFGTLWHEALAEYFEQYKCEHLA